MSKGAVPDVSVITCPDNPAKGNHEIVPIHLGGGQYEWDCMFCGVSWAKLDERVRQNRKKVAT